MSNKTSTNLSPWGGGDINLTVSAAEQLVGGTITTVGSTLVGCTSVGAANTTGNATTATNFNNGTSYSSAGNVVANTFTGPVNTVVATPSGGTVAINNGGGDTIFYGTSALTNYGDGSVPTSLYGTSLTYHAPSIYPGQTPINTKTLEINISLAAGESIDIRFKITGISNEKLKIKYNSGVSLTNPVTSLINTSGFNFGTAADDLCLENLNSQIQTFTITVTYDGTYYLIYQSGVMFCQTSTAAACTFSAYTSGALTKIQLIIVTGTMVGYYTTKKYIA
jgi:hypothetical protein